MIINLIFSACFFYNNEKNMSMIKRDLLETKA